MSYSKVEFAQIRSDWKKSLNKGAISFFADQDPMFQDVNGSIISGNQRHVIQVGTTEKDEYIVYLKAVDAPATIESFSAINTAVHFVKEFLEKCLGSAFEEVIGDIAMLAFHVHAGVADLVDEMESEWEMAILSPHKPRRNPVGSVYIEAEGFELFVEKSGGDFVVDEEKLEVLKDSNEQVSFKILSWIP